MAFRRFTSQVGFIKNCQSVLYIHNLSTVSGSSPRFLHSYLTPCVLHRHENTSLTLNCNNRSLHITTCRDAGHSKWSNIKHVKGAQDKARGEKTSVLARKLQFCLSKNPEKNPKLNTELANLIKWARTNNIPNDVIDKTVDRQIKLRDQSNLTVFEGRGPSNIGVVLECFALKPVHTKGLLQGVIKKYGFSLNSPAADLFDHKGIVEAEIPESELEAALNDPDNFPIDKYIDIAIEAGAEDVTLQSDSEKHYLEFVCGHQDCDKVQDNVENAGLVVASSERSYIPTTLVPASKEFIQSLNILKEKLDNHPDVVKYYFNIIPES